MWFLSIFESESFNKDRIEKEGVREEMTLYMEMGILDFEELRGEK